MLAAPPEKEKVDFAAVLAAPAYAGKTLELLDGKVQEKMPTNPYCSAVALRIAFHLTVYLMSNPIGHVTGADGGYYMNDEAWFVPDVGFISKERQPEFPRSGYNPLPPDLAVEVISPTDLFVQVDQKVQAYLRYGTRLVWLVNPASQTVTVYRPNAVRLLNLDERLTGDDVLPGFDVSVRDLFPA